MRDNWLTCSLGTVSIFLGLIAIGLSLCQSSESSEQINTGFATVQEEFRRFEERYPSAKSLDPGSFADNVSRAAELATEGRLDESRSYLNAALELAETADQQTLIQLRLGNLEEDAGKNDSALEHYRSAVAASDSATDRGLAAAALGSLANQMKNRGSFNVANELYEEALAIQESINDGTSTAKTLFNLGLLRGLQGDVESSLSFYMEAEMAYQATGDLRGEGKSVLAQARIATERSDEDLQDLLLDKADRLIVESGDPAALAELRSYQANVHRWDGEYKDAMAKAVEALEIVRIMGLRYQESEILGLLGYISRSSGDFEGAISYHNTALGLKKALGDRHGEGVANLDLAFVYQVTGDAENTEAFAQAAIEIAKEIGFPKLEAAGQSSLGAALIGQGRIEEGLRAQCQSWVWFDISGFAADAALEASTILRIHGSTPEELC